jgi:hypothetical protein
MINLDECKEALNMPDLTDEEILKVRNKLYSLVSKILDEQRKT